ncbi:alpha/beta hydrolase [Saccharothrix longispora]|uniref:Pimeloyl-ACP methyl ester carboxylesterase n=1 Tax=Saccharothrix longispora TaxID=33920 RepID=A0ABU1Q6W4_9PSEU|nr:alpha/beta hydrolase-fold protein [Saccharothrix longispora]MDR6598640.1 pimeloyl-ACP methyl ester carboxylesterase [Saccharothrix longispora]
MVSRRTVLTASVGSALAAVGIAAVHGDAPFGEALRHAVGVAGPVPAVKRAVVRVERVRSEHRGREVDLLTLVPPGVPTGGLPMSILLHGRYGTARLAAFGGLPEVLVAAVGRGSVPPFGFVAVDGGDNYWHENHPGDDPMAMLLEEVPTWLAERGYGAPFACTGVSMGGFGALLYGRRRTERRERTAAVAAVSPALITTWEEMAKRDAFRGPEQWARLDPLRNLDKLGDAPIGVWVGDRDRFVDGTTTLLKNAKLAVESVTPGGHDDAFYRRIVPDVVRFLGRRVPR